jgi:hypothetical protein
MNKIIVFLFSIALLSCSAPVNDDATAVCNCYKELYKISSDKVVQMEAVTDSCQKLHAGILNKYESDSVAFNQFVEAYTYCQNQ